MRAEGHFDPPERSADSGVRVEGELRVGEGAFPVFFRSADSGLRGSNEALASCLILPALKEGLPLMVKGGISRRLTEALPTVADIYRCWEPGLAPLRTEGMTPFAREGRGGEGVAAFFTGGVDSFYTLMKHREEITHLVYVLGFDLPRGNEDLVSKVTAMVRRVADHYAMQPVLVETNLLEFMNGFVDWGRLGHGPALAAVGHLFSSRFRRIYIPASHTYRDLFPWGSHPLLDPLFSSEGLEFVHDGCETGRVDKVRIIAQSEIVLDNLRVCWENRRGAYNCGRCEKCLRTMISLLVAGALDRCPVFESPLDVARVRETRAWNPSGGSYARENRRALEAWNGDPKLRKALLKALRPPRGAGDGAW